MRNGEIVQKIEKNWSFSSFDFSHITSLMYGFATIDNKLVINQLNSSSGDVKIIGKLS